MTFKISDYPKQKAPLLKAINFVGSAYSFAHKLGITRQAVHWWLHHSDIAPPIKHCKSIEELTNGTVTRQQLRPDIFG